MIKLKKIMALAIGMVMTSSLILTGCGSSNNGSKTDANSEPVNLVWYTIGTPQNDTEKVQEKINEYTKDKINATVTIKQIDWGDYTKKMQVVINSGEEFDICFTCSWANDYLVNARKGAFVELNDLLDKYGKETKEAIDPAFWEGAKIDGKIYAIPTNKELGVLPSWVFTKEYVDKYNIDITNIHSLEDLEPVLEIIKEKEPDVVPFFCGKNYSVPLVDTERILGPVGIQEQDGKLKAVNIFETDEMKQALQTMHKFYKNGYVNKDAATLDGNHAKEIKRFVSKADGQPYADVLWSKDLGYEVVSNPIHKAYVTNASTTGAMQAISITSKHKEKAMEFLNLLNTDKYLRNLVNYGIEGVHYEKIDDSSIKLLPEAKEYSMPYFSLGNLFITYTLDNEPKDKWEEFKKFNENSKRSPALGFNFDPNSVSTEVAAFQNILSEFEPSLYTGTVDPDEYLPKINKKLKEAGVDKVIEEMQKQLDDWVKNNK